MKGMTPEDHATFEKLRERAFLGGANTVCYGTEYYSTDYVTDEVRFFVKLERAGWDRTWYGKVLHEVFTSVEIYLDERGW